MSGAEGEGVTVTEHLRLPRRRESYVWPRDDADWYVEPTWCSIRLFAVESFVGHVHNLAARGEKPGGGKTDFAWLVFEQGYTGEPAIGWLRREVQ
jgi:hypothetical protein